MRINHNLSAMNANRQMGINQSGMAKSLEKLSSGLKINRAADDASGLSISEKMRAQIRGLDQASSNAQDGVSLIQTADGNLSETEDILQRVRELAVKGATGTLAAEDSQAVQDEVKSLLEEVDRIGNTTEFNTKKLLNGELENAAGVAAGTNQTIGNNVAKDAAGKIVSTDPNGIRNATDLNFQDEELTIDGNKITVHWGNLTSAEKEKLKNANTNLETKKEATQLIADTINKAIDSSGTGIEHVKGYVDSNGQVVLESGTKGSKSDIDAKGGVVSYMVGGGARGAAITALDGKVASVTLKTASVAAKQASADLKHASATALTACVAAKALQVCAKERMILDPAHATSIATIRASIVSLTTCSNLKAASATAKHGCAAIKTASVQIKTASLTIKVASVAALKPAAIASMKAMTMNGTAGSSTYNQSTVGAGAVFDVKIGDQSIGQASLTNGIVNGTTTMASAATILADTINKQVQQMNQTNNLTQGQAGFIQDVTVDVKDGRLVINSESGKVAMTDRDGSDIAESLGLSEAQTSSSANGGMTLQIGANKGQTMTFGIADMRTAALGLSNVDLSSQEGSSKSLEKLDGAIAKVSKQRSTLGAAQNRLEHTIKNLDTSSENLQSAESRIRDTDMSKEMMSYTKLNILSQAAQSMLAQANQAPQGVLQLLQ